MTSLANTEKNLLAGPLGITATGWQAGIALDEGIRAVYHWFLDNIDALRG